MSGKCFRIYILFPLLFFPEAVNERVDMCVLCAAFFLVLCINKKVLQHMFTVIQQQRPCRKCEDFLFFLSFFFKSLLVTENVQESFAHCIDVE